MNPIVKFRRTRRGAILPRYAHGPGEDAGMDLYAAEDAELRPLAPTVVDTGWEIEIAPGFEGQIRPRSGLACKNGVTVVNAPGTIDPGYRGPLKVGLIWLIDVRHHGAAGFLIPAGDRIAQLVIAPYSQAAVREVMELSESERGANGFGSTGK